MLTLITTFTILMHLLADDLGAQQLSAEVQTCYFLNERLPGFL